MKSIARTIGRHGEGSTNNDKTPEVRTCNGKRVREDAETEPPSKNVVRRCMKGWKAHPACQSAAWRRDPNEGANEQTVTIPGMKADRAADTDGECRIHR